MSTHFSCNHIYHYQEVNKYGKDYLEALLRTEREIPERATATWRYLRSAHYELRFEWSEVNHDKYCPCSWPDADCSKFTNESGDCFSCNCVQIAEIRADERDQAAERLRTYLDGGWIRPEIVEIWTDVIRFGGERE